MLTPEQTTIRLRDTEISRLRQENERLTSRIKEIKTACVGRIQYLASSPTLNLSMSHKVEILKMAKELEESI